MHPALPAPPAPRAPEGGAARCSMPRAAYCGSAAMSAVDRMGPAGTRAEFIAAMTSAAGRAATHSSITWQGAGPAGVAVGVAVGAKRARRSNRAT